VEHVLAFTSAVVLCSRGGLDAYDDRGFQQVSARADDLFHRATIEHSTYLPRACRKQGEDSSGGRLSWVRMATLALGGIFVYSFDICLRTCQATR
jgi:hypothetical protein